MCGLHCSVDLHSVIDCHGNVVQTCPSTEACDVTTLTCISACQAAANDKQSVGCEFYATDMDNYFDNPCFAAFVTNVWNAPIHVAVDFSGSPLAVANFARIPSGSGPSLTYSAYDPVGGLPPGEAVILFLAGGGGGSPVCPVTPAVAASAQLFQQTGIGYSFHITTDAPAAAYEINPYGGGSAATAGGSLLLPASAWDVNYVAVTAAPYDIDNPSINIVASQDSTTITMLPKVAVAGGGVLPAGPPNVPYVFLLNRGEMAQFTQQADLTGTIVQSDKPVGIMAGQVCMRAPMGVAYCDHGEQMLPPVKALGSAYVGVMYRPRVAGDAGFWHLVGVVDGTTLTYSTPVGGPPTLSAGQSVDFVTDQPFVVTSQDSMHPFMLFTVMSGSQWTMLSNTQGYGDPDFVLSVSPEQYLNDYVFFTDPTYPETNLVIVRAQNASNSYDDVTLDCAGVLTGWQPVGNYEWTRVDLISHNFQNQGSCSTGRHQIQSKSPFGLWIWGWGSPETTTFTQNVSYGYPGGMSVLPINSVVIPAK
jgi:hypothetical protein